MGMMFFRSLKYEVTSIVALATALRLGLLGYGEWQDQTMAVKFTDVDYYVFHDAASFMSLGESPYQRATYRYTPLLAWLLQPNIICTPIFGKLLFILFDVLTGYLIYNIVRSRNTPHRQSMICASFWLLNPLPMTVSSRGNAESIMSFLVLMCLKLLMDNQVILAGIVYALSVHVKIYPVTYALPIYLLLGRDYSQNYTHVTKARQWQSTLKSLMPNKNRMMFILSSFITLGGLTWIYYHWYGLEFLHNTYLYHVTRQDIRHNFSIYFYLLYLQTGAGNSALLSLVAFIPQLVLLVAFSVRFYRDPGLAFFLNTFAFVAFNKVCTSQYFLWYLCLLPLLLPNISVSMTTAIATICCWFIGQGIWLLPAYYLEFQGYNTFLYIWVASLLFFSTYIYIMYVVVGNYRPSPWHCQPGVEYSGSNMDTTDHDDSDCIKHRLRNTARRKPKHRT